jgi:hypothetical protein
VRARALWASRRPNFGVSDVPATSPTLCHRNVPGVVSKRTTGQPLFDLPPINSLSYMGFIDRLFGLPDLEKDNSANSQTTQMFKNKADKAFNKIISDKRWNMKDELLFNVFGLTFYGYCFGLGRMIFLLDVEVINSYVEGKLVGLGAGKKYVKGMIEKAHSTFLKASDSYESQLVGVGHSHMGAKDLTQLTNSVFENAALLRSR